MPELPEPEYISKEEALAAVRAAAWTERPEPEDATCGHPGCTDHPGQGRKLIHGMTGFGSDWSLESAEDAINTAQRCAWVWHLLRHELAVLRADSKPVYFDVRRPGESMLERAERLAQAGAVS